MRTLCPPEGRPPSRQTQAGQVGAPPVCLVLVTEKLAPQGSLLALPSEHRPEGRKPLYGPSCTRSACTRSTTPLVGHEIGLLGHSEHGVRRQTTTENMWLYNT